MAKTTVSLCGLPAAAEELGIDVRALRKEVEAGRIPGMRVGRVWKIPAWWLRQWREGPKDASNAKAA